MQNIRTVYEKIASKTPGQSTGKKSALNAATWINTNGRQRNHSTGPSSPSGLSKVSGGGQTHFDMEKDMLRGGVQDERKF